MQFCRRKICNFFCNFFFHKSVIFIWLILLKIISDFITVDWAIFEISCTHITKKLFGKKGVRKFCKRKVWIFQTCSQLSLICDSSVRRFYSCSAINRKILKKYTKFHLYLFRYLYGRKKKSNNQVFFFFLHLLKNLILSFDVHL